MSTFIPIYNPNKIIIEMRVRGKFIYKAKKLLFTTSDKRPHLFSLRNWALIKDPLVGPDGVTVSNKATGAIATFFCFGKEDELLNTCETIRTALIECGIERPMINITIGKEA
jgi:hypothetical protein